MSGLQFADLEEIAAGGDLEGIQALLLQERLLKKLKDQQEQVIRIRMVSRRKLMCTIRM